MTPAQRRLYDLLPHPDVPAGRTIRELAAVAGASPAAVHATLKRLMRDGWVEEARCGTCQATHGYRRRNRN